MMFQSSPAPRSGCNYAVSRLYALLSVSILTRSEERVQRRAEQRFKRAFDVSILTRSEEQVQLEDAVARHHRLQCFNPHRLRGAGATSRDPGEQAAQGGFNPHPLRGAGATKERHGEGSAENVSILTRSEERVQPGKISTATQQSFTFQSSPAPRSGCNGRHGRHADGGNRFNPHPLRGAGATRSA